MIADKLDLLKKSLPLENLKTSALTTEMGAYQYGNEGDDDEVIEFGHDKRLIHFLFSLSEEIRLSSEVDDGIVELNAGNFFMFSNPYTETALEIKLPPGGKILSIIISMKELHEIFGSSFGGDAAATKDFMESYKMKRFFVEKELTPSIAVIAHQFFSGINRPNVRRIYQQGKVMEFLSLYMDTPNSVDELENHCPFVLDAQELKKIKEAREIIIDRMMDPPSLKSLARLVGTNEFKLKVGFKSVFSNTVYGYLSDHRMEQARKLLTVDNSRIKEVAIQVGYSNPSHFIAAYKRKYGITPKQHLMSIVA
jgi:AraC family transcriptional regulator, transcriptional activator of the genes for pyochelin and ferripyochelin receptors